jgi:WD40 repeat protein
MLTTLDNVNIITFNNLKCCSIAFATHARSDHKAFLAVGFDNGDITLCTPAVFTKGECCSNKLRGHQRVNSMAFSTHRRHHNPLLALGSDDYTVRLWNIRTRKCVAVLIGHTSWVRSVAFSPDGCLLASASGDGTVRLWDVMKRKRKTASLVHELRGHTDWVFSVSFSSDGRQLASGSYDCTVRLWSVPEGAPGPVLEHNRAVWCVAFSPVVGSNLLASGSTDGIIRLWDVSGTNPRLLRELQGHSSYINSVAFSPDGSQLVSGSWEKTVQLWNVASGQLLKSLKGQSINVKSVAFHPNGKQVASCSDDKIVRIWTVCEWSDRVHQLFGPEMKRLVFCLMCIKEKIECTENRIVPQLPMALWLDIFTCL